jgi:succinate dehydrogenase / fumarate reductase cytochrome b subunit
MSTVSADAVAMAAHDHGFFWRRFHSLTGIVPVGAFLIEHLASNAAALRGADAHRTSRPWPA